MTHITLDFQRIGGRIVEYPSGDTKIVVELPAVLINTSRILNTEYRDTLIAEFGHEFAAEMEEAAGNFLYRKQMTHIIARAVE